MFPEVVMKYGREREIDVEKRNGVPQPRDAVKVEIALSLVS